MITTKSSFKGSRFRHIYGSTLKGQVPFMIAAAVILFVIITVVFIAGAPDPYLSYSSIAPAQETQETAELMQYKIRQYYAGEFDAGIYVDIGQSGVVAFVLTALAFVCALFSNSYMHSKSKTDLYHSLPVRRPVLLGANMLASLTTVLLPYTAVTLLTMLGQLIVYGRYNCFGWAYFSFMAADWLMNVLFVAVVDVMVSFVAVQVGTVFDTLAVSGVLGFAPMFVFLISGGIWSNLTYGAVFEPGEWTVFFSPYTFGYLRYAYVDTLDLIGLPYAYNLANILPFLLAWLVIGALLFAGAILFYNRRRSEIAEQPQPKGVLQIIVKCFIAFCGSALFYLIFRGSGFIGCLFAVVAGAVVIGIVAELILSRGIKNLLRGLLLLGGTGVACSVLLVLVYLDVFGYVERVPALEQVSGVYISYSGRNDRSYYYNSTEEDMLALPDTIATVLDMHRTAVENPPGYTFPFFRYDYGGEYTGVHISVRYKLKNGFTMKRYYYTINSAAAEKLVNLEDKEDFIRTKSDIFRLDNSLPASQRAQMRCMLTVRDGYSRMVVESTVLSVGQEELLTAIREDKLSETLEDILHPGGPAIGYVQLLFEQPDWEAKDKRSYSVGFMVQPQHHRTIRVLQQLGLYDRMTVNVSEVDAVYLVDGFSYDPARVQTVSVGIKAYEFEIDGYEEGEKERSAIFLKLDSPADIAQAAAAGRNQWYAPYSGDSEREIVKAVFVIGGEVAGEQFLPLELLPASLRQRVNEARGAADSDTIFPALAVSARVVTP